MGVITIGILTGDRRAECMIPFLLEKGFRIITYGGKHVQDTEQATDMVLLWEEASAIVGGTPVFAKENITEEEVLQALQKTQYVKNHQQSKKRKLFLGGVLRPEFCSEIEENGVLSYDFMKEERIAAFNTIATAEGAIAEAILHQPTNLHGSQCLILGYGRCAKVLARKLKGLDANVTITCRNPKELAMAQALGFGAFPLERLKAELWKYEFIFNTIPRIILQRPQLLNTMEHVLIVDIASGEGGVDFKTAQELGIQTLHCLGLPGTYAPVSSARILAEYTAEKVMANC